MLVFGEFAPDVAPYNSDTCVVAKNCLPAPVGYRPLPSGEVPTAGINCGDESRDCLGFAIFKTPSTSGGRQCLATVNDSTAKIEVYVNSGGDVIQSGVTLSSNSFGSPIKMLNWDFDLLVFGALSAPQKVTTFTGPSTDIGGSPPDSADAAIVNKFVVLASPSMTNWFRVQWSAFDDYEEWTAGTDQAGFEDLDAAKGSVVAIIGGSDGVVFQEYGITRMTYVGLPNIWDFEPITNAPGMFGPGHGVAVQNDIYYLSQAGFYVLKNRVEPIPIGINRVDRWFRDQVGFEDASNIYDTDFMYKITCGYDPVAHQVWWAFPAADQTGSDLSSAINNRVLIYDIALDKWSHADISAQKFATAVPFLIDNTTSKSFQQHGIAWVDNDGTNNAVHVATGTAMASTIETAAMFSEKGRLVVDSARPVINGDCTLSVLTRDELPSDSETEDGPTSPDADGKVDFEAEGRYHRIKMVTSGDFEDAIGVVLDSTPAGTR